MTRVECDCARVLRASASADALPLSITSIGCRRWASALFAGYRLTMSVEAADDAHLDEWLIALPDRELTWRGHFVASAEVVERCANAATIEILVVES